MARLDSRMNKMPCGSVHPKQRVIGDDVPDFAAALSRRGGLLGAASSQTQFWSMPVTYPGSVTLSSIKFLGLFSRGK
jgi:hypothetical protein